MSNTSSSNLAVGLLLGVAAGVIIGLLYAPRRGNETRALLKEKAAELSERAEEFAENVRLSAAKYKQDRG